MGKLIVHIGPPKTGSTSLQYYLQSLQRNDVYYCGVFQPRSNYRESIADQCYRYCNEGTEADVQVDILKENIAEKLRKYEYVFLSEEMFALQTRKSNWQEKLSRLNTLLSSFSPCILFFVREIDAVLPSFYQEIYKGLPQSLQDDFSAFEQSNYASAYNYKQLYELLLKSGFEEIIWLKFTSLIHHRYHLSDFFGVSTLENNELVRIGKQNKSKINNGTRILERKHSVEAYFDRLRILMPKRFRGKGLLVPLIKFLRASTRVEKELKVSAFSKEHYQMSMQFFKDNGE